MRILFVHSLTIQRDDILWGIIELGIDVESSTTLVDLDAVEEDKVESLVAELAGYDLAFSQNFSATLAENLPHHQQPIDLYTKQSITANYGVPT